MAENDTYYVTHCSGKKEKKGRTIAIRRYKSERIRWVYNKSVRDRVNFAILSGLFGLVKPEKIIPYYNCRMRKEDVDGIRDKNKKFIEDELNKGKKIKKIVYFTENPVCEPDLRYYFQSLDKAISKLKKETKLTIEFDVRLIQKKTYEEVDEEILRDLFENKKYYESCDDAE